MSKIVGTSDFKFEKASLKTSFLWKFKQHKFGEYLEYNDRCKTGLHCTDAIRFETGFLAATNHYAQVFITQEDCNMYLKIFFEGSELSSQFTSYEVSAPRVYRKFDNGSPSTGVKITDALQQQLIARRHFTEEDFTPGETSSVYWLYWDANSYDVLDNCQRLRVFNGDSITFDFEFNYCSWDRNKKGMNFNLTNDEESMRFLAESGKNNSMVSTKEFLFSSKFSDFVIECGNKSFPVHRMVIASKSQVLAAMLEQPLKESKEGKLTIEDSEPEAVEEFVRFMYTGNANVQEHGEELLELAHKYEIADLQRISEFALIDQVTERNLVDINELGKIYKSDRLQDYCYSFFKSKRSELLKTVTDVDMYNEFMLKLALE